MSNRNIVGFAALACVACCIGPILGLLGTVAALGVVSAPFIGVAGFAIATAAIGALIVVRRRRARQCATTPEPVPVEFSRTTT